MPDIVVSVADYLKNVALFTAAASPSGVAWTSDRAVETEIISPLRDKADADAEATREAAFLKGPLVEEVVRVSGARRDLMLKAVTIKGDRMGYGGAGATVYVIGFAELDNNETDLIVLRSLA